MLHTSLMIIHFFSAAGIISLVLLQRGKGAEAGAGFGAGASGHGIRSSRRRHRTVARDRHPRGHFHVDQPVADLRGLAHRGSAEHRARPAVPARAQSAPAGQPETGESRAGQRAACGSSAR